MKPKTVTIGLEGCMIHTGNLGCAALTWSLLAMLERIAGAAGMTFRYKVFENDPDSGASARLCGSLGIPASRLEAVKTTSLFHPLAEAKHPVLTARALSAMKECRLFIDLTQGDSFTDIYGNWRFLGFTRIKERILRMNRPLILGPQTYGPFRDEKNAARAADVLAKAQCVLARDETSAQAVLSLCGRSVPALTDLAFGLPGGEKRPPSSGRIRVGINASSLLVRDRTEPTEVRFQLKTDYDRYLREILGRLAKDSRAEVFLIPHVGRDAGEQFRDGFPAARFLPPFRDPSEAKDAIAGMDVLIAGRMHAAIAALSSGTAVIPTAYSPKFSGLFHSLSYPYLIDLTSLETEEAVRKTMELIESREQLRQAALACRPAYEKALAETEALLTRQILLAADGGRKET